MIDPAGAGGGSPVLDDRGRPLLNPSMLFVDGNYALRLNAWCSVAGVTLGMRYRFLRGADAQVVDSAEQLAPTSNRVLTTNDFQLSIGYPLTIEIFALGGTPTIGQCFVQVQIVRGRGPAAAVFATILQGYITPTNALAWPGSPLEKALDGVGALRSITAAVPGAGAEISETVPAGVRWELLTFRMQLLTSATVANRIKALLLDDGALEYHRVESSNNQAASTTFIYVHAQGHAASSAGVGNVIHGHLPGNIRLGAGHRIRTSTGAIQVGDQYSVIQYLVREWLTAD